MRNQAARPGIGRAGCSTPAASGEMWAGRLPPSGALTSSTVLGFNGVSDLHLSFLRLVIWLCGAPACEGRPLVYGAQRSYRRYLSPDCLSALPTLPRRARDLQQCWGSPLHRPSALCSPLRGQRARLHWSHCLSATHGHPAESMWDWDPLHAPWCLL